MNLFRRLARLFKPEPQYDPAVVERIWDGVRDAGEPMSGDEAQRQIDGMFAHDGYDDAIVERLLEGACNVSEPMSAEEFIALARSRRPGGDGTKISTSDPTGD